MWQLNEKFNFYEVTERATPWSFLKLYNQGTITVNDALLSLKIIEKRV